jgi:hypothetical protein
VVKKLRDFFSEEEWGPEDQTWVGSAPKPEDLPIDRWILLKRLDSPEAHFL